MKIPNSEFQNPNSKAVIIYALIANLILWLLLTQTFYYQSLVCGIAVSLFTAILFFGYYLYPGSKLFQPKRYLYLLAYIPFFAVAVIKANLDVMYRVIHPDRPLNPGIVKIKTNLKTDIGRTFLANSITLTPGTMSCEIVDDCLYIHWIDVKATDEEEASRKIAHPFEKYLKNIFE
uniref:Na+/H+ antiporter subunit E n=1 Tax=candidate division WOR-3 bacterium TaxID=2052148 RepID=A0A7C6AAA3_UNCW3